MKWNTSLATLERTLKEHPEWREPISRVMDVVRTVPPGTAIDPYVVANQVALNTVEVLAYFHVLERVHLGQVLFRVVDSSGIEVRRYERWENVPAIERDDFGSTFRVEPEMVELIFSAVALP
jgi:hypothetical protein